MIHSINEFLKNCKRSRFWAWAGEALLRILYFRIAARQSGESAQVIAGGTNSRRKRGTRSSSTKSVDGEIDILLSEEGGYAAFAVV